MTSRILLLIGLLTVSAQATLSSPIAPADQEVTCHDNDQTNHHIHFFRAIQALQSNAVTDAIKLLSVDSFATFLMVAMHESSVLKPCGYIGIDRVIITTVSKGFVLYAIDLIEDTLGIAAAAHRLIHAGSMLVPMVFMHFWNPFSGSETICSRFSANRKKLLAAVAANAVLSMWAGGILYEGTQYLFGSAARSEL